MARGAGLRVVASDAAHRDLATSLADRTGDLCR
jgi:hypothetical protein